MSGVACDVCCCKPCLSSAKLYQSEVPACADCSKLARVIDVWAGHLDDVHLPDLGWQQAERVPGEALDM